MNAPKESLLNDIRGAKHSYLPVIIGGATIGLFFHWGLNENRILKILNPPRLILSLELGSIAAVAVWLAYSSLIASMAGIPRREILKKDSRTYWAFAVFFLILTDYIYHVAWLRGLLFCIAIASFVWLKLRHIALIYFPSERNRSHYFLIRVGVVLFFFIIVGVIAVKVKIQGWIDIIIFLQLSIAFAYLLWGLLFPFRSLLKVRKALVLGLIVLMAAPLLYKIINEALPKDPETVLAALPEADGAPKFTQVSTSGKMWWVKVKVNNEWRNSLVLKPPIRVETIYKMVPANGKVVFSLSTLPLTWNKPGDGVAAMVYVREGDSKDRQDIELFYIDPKHRPKERDWLERKVDLSRFAGKKIVVGIEVMGSPPAEPPFKGQPDNQHDYLVIGDPRLQMARTDMRPNILFILVDTLRADHLGAWGYERDTSPTIDRLAREGVMFLNTFAESSHTPPSTASILTSTYPDQHGVKHFLSLTLASKAVLLPEVLREAGYRTIASTANPLIAVRFGFGQGFDVFNELCLKRPTRGSAECITETIRKSVRPDRAEFVYIHMIDPHEKYTPPEPYREMFLPKEGPKEEEVLDGGIKWFGKKYFWKKKMMEMDSIDKDYLMALYDGEVRYTDDAIGGLLESLSDSGWLDNALVVITSDHGEEFMDHGSLGHGHTLYQELVRIPLVLWWPNKLPRGRVIEGLVRSLDIAPTILELAGIPIPKEMLGEKMAEVIRGEKPLPQLLSYSELGSRWFDLERSLRSPDWMISIRPVIGGVSLYNLAHDPIESNDLSEREPEAAKQLTEALEEFRARFAAGDGHSGPMKMDRQTIEALESLGYIGGK